MIMNEEPVRLAIQQSSQMIEETLAANMRRFKGGSAKRRDVRRKRSPREGDNPLNNSICNQGKLCTDDNSYYCHMNGMDKVPQLHYPFAHYNQQSYQLPQQQQFQHQQQQFHFQQQQQRQVPPTSPIHITPPISSSHPLSSFQTPNQPIPAPNNQPLFICSSQLQMPMQFPIPMPPVNYDGSVNPLSMQMSMQMPLQMPMHMPNMPLPMFIRLPAPPCVSPAPNNTEDNFKSNISSGGVGSPSTTNATVVNFIPLMFPSHLGPMLFGPSQPMMVTRMSGSPNFHQMVNENLQRSATQQNQSTK